MLRVEEKQIKNGFWSLVDDNAVGTAGQQLRDALAEELQNKGQSVFWAEAIVFLEAQRRINSLAELRSNWDSYGAPAPNARSRENALRILRHMKPSDLALANIVPAAEGGIAFFFVKGNRYADLEASNDGDVIGVRYTGKETPFLIQTDGSEHSIQLALEEIRDHISA